MGLPQLPQNHLVRVLPVNVFESLCAFMPSPPFVNVIFARVKRWLFAKDEPVVFWQLEQWQRTEPLSVPVIVYWMDWQRQEPDIEGGEVILESVVALEMLIACESLLSAHFNDRQPRLELCA